MKQQDWKTLDIDEALNGKRVGIANTQNYNDISKTGVVEKTEYDGGRRVYQTKIGPYTVKFDEDGVILSTKPANASMVGTTLKMIDTTTANTSGASVVPWTAPGEEPKEPVDLSELEPRDHFAMTALGALIAKMSDPANADDGNMLFCCRAAYRWANNMMTAAADARLGTLQEYEEDEAITGNVTVDVTITNDSEDDIVISPRLRFVLSTEGKKSRYSCIRTEAASLGNADITIAAGQSQTFTDVTIPGDSKKYAGQHFAESNELEGYASNVLLYDVYGDSETIVPKLVNPSEVFADEGTYTVVYTGQQPEPTPGPEPVDPTSLSGMGWRSGYGDGGNSTPDGVRFVLVNNTGERVQFSGKLKLYAYQSGSSDQYLHELAAYLRPAERLDFWMCNPYILDPGDKAFVELDWGNNGWVNAFQSESSPQYLPNFNGWLFPTTDSPTNLPAVKLDHCILSGETQSGVDNSAFIVHVVPLGSGSNEVVRGTVYNLVIDSVDKSAGSGYNTSTVYPPSNN